MFALIDFLYFLFDCDSVSEDDNEAETEANAMITQCGIAESLKDH